MDTKNNWNGTEIISAVKKANVALNSGAALDQRQPELEPAHPASLSDPQAALCWSLMEKSIARRESYASRASVIVAASALLVTAVSFFLASKSSGYVMVRPWGAGALLLCLSTCLCSIVYGLLSIVYVGSRHRMNTVVRSADLPPRVFVSANDTFVRFGARGYPAFAEELERLCQSDLNRSLAAQLFVGLYFERTRVRHLRQSARLLILASVLLFVALLATTCARSTTRAKPIDSSLQLKELGNNR